MTSLPIRMAAFAAVLVVAFIAAFAVGRVAGPFDPDDAPEPGHRPDEHGSERRP